MAEFEDSLQDVPLLDLCNDSHRLCRLLIEHLEQAFIPKVMLLQKTVQPVDPAKGEKEPSDVEVRNRAAEVLEQDQHTRRLDGDLTRHLQAMEREIDEIAKQSEL